jgi:transcriptional antiterminator NusG
MYGKVSEIDVEKQQLKVLIDLFGQETPVEVSISQVEKA